MTKDIKDSPNRDNPGRCLCFRNIQLLGLSCNIGEFVSRVWARREYLAETHADVSYSAVYQHMGTGQLRARTHATRRAYRLGATRHWSQALQEGVQDYLVKAK